MRVSSRQHVTSLRNARLGTPGATLPAIIPLNLSLSSSLFFHARNLARNDCATTVATIREARDARPRRPGGSRSCRIPRRARSRASVNVRKGRLDPNLGRGYSDGLSSSPRRTRSVYASAAPILIRIRGHPVTAARPCTTLVQSRTREFLHADPIDLRTDLRREYRAAHRKMRAAFKQTLLVSSATLREISE